VLRPTPPDAADSPCARRGPSPRLDGVTAIDTNRAMRETLGPAGFPAPEQRVRRRSQG